GPGVSAARPGGASGGGYPDPGAGHLGGKRRERLAGGGRRARADGVRRDRRARVAAREGGSSARSVLLGLQGDAPPRRPAGGGDQDPSTHLLVPDIRESRLTAGSGDREGGVGRHAFRRGVEGGGGERRAHHSPLPRRRAAARDRRAGGGVVFGRSLPGHRAGRGTDR